MELESRIQALIAVGASVSTNCQPCLRSAVALAVKSGAGEREIADAIEVGKRIRRGAGAKMDKFASELSLADRALTTAEAGCGCGLI